MIMVKPESCDLCGTCVAVCPQDCIELSETQLLIDRQQCNGCRLCVLVCPFGSLKEEAEHVDSV